jgi:hypothetical protein
MGSGSDLAATAETASTAISPRRPRRYYRHKVRSLAYVNLDHANGGIIRDLSPAGIAIQSVSPLQVAQQVHLRFELLSPRTRVEATGRVVWADSSGQGGLEFCGLSQGSGRLLKEWIFIQLLSAAQSAAGIDSIFVHGNRGEAATELLFSAAPRPAIRLDPPPPCPAPVMPGGILKPLPVRFPWCPVPISLPSLARLVDGLILFSAVLLFSLIVLSMTNIFPSWPVGLALAGVVTGILVALYWFLFAFWTGITPGQHLAELAGSSSERVPAAEDQPRFR